MRLRFNLFISPIWLFIRDTVKILIKNLSSLLRPDWQSNNGKQRKSGATAQAFRKVPEQLFPPLLLSRPP